MTQIATDRTRLPQWWKRSSALGACQERRAREGNALPFRLTLHDRVYRCTSRRFPWHHKQGLKDANMPISIMALMLLTLLSTIQLSQGATLPQVGVVTDPSEVQRTRTTMKVYTQLISPIPLLGKVVITLPQEMDLTAPSSLTGFCTMNIPSNVVASCQIYQAKELTVTFDKIVPSGSFEIQINNGVTNPTSTTPTSSFTFMTYSFSGLVLDQLTSGIQYVATTGTFISAILASSDQTVGVTTNLNVRLTPNHRLPANGQIRMTLPKWNPEATTDQLEYLQGAIQCTSLNTAVLVNNLQCSFSNSVLLVTNLASADVPGGTEMGFRITGFRNPLSTALVSGFQFIIEDNLGGDIDVLTNATLQITTAAEIASSSFTVDAITSAAVQGYVGESNVMQVSFSSPVPLNQGCKIIISLPTQFSLSDIKYVTISGLLGAQRNVTFSPDSASLAFSFSSCQSYTTNQLAGIIRIDSLTLPTFAKATDRLNVEIRDKNDNKVARTYSGPTFTPKPGTGLLVNLTASPDTILSSSDLLVTVYPQRTIGPKTQFILQFPDKFVPLAGVCATFTSVTTDLVKGTPGSCSMSGQTLTLTDFVALQIDKGTNKALQFKIGRVILPSFMAQRNFLAWLKRDDGIGTYWNVELLNTVIPVTLTYGSVNALVIPASNTSYDTTNYTFIIKPDHRVDINGYIEIFYPKNISIPDPSFSQSQCRQFSGFPTTPTCVIDAVNRKISINNGFRVSSTATPQYQFNIPGIVNPLTLDPTDTFKIYTKTSDGIIMDQLLNGLTLTMKFVPSLRSVVLTPGSLVNSAITNYTFLITSPVPVNNTFSVVFAFPPEITVPTDASTLRCTSDDTTLIQTLTCSLFTLSSSTKAVRAQLTLRSGISGINPLQTFKITVNTIKNPISTNRTTSFDVYIYDGSLGLVAQLNKTTNPVTVMTNTPSTLGQANFTANTTGAGQIAAYSINIIPLNMINTGGGLIVIYPSQIGVSSAGISAIVSAVNTNDSPTVKVETSARRIVITNLFAADYTPDLAGITVKISGFVNPLYNTEKTNSFVVRTLNTDSSGNFYFIDQVSDGLILNSPCDYPCSTCATDKPSKCLSCYQTSELNKLQGDTCVSVCSTGKYYNNTNFSCDNCSSSCLACVDNKDKCTQCGVGNLLYLYNTTCRSDCPDGWVTDQTKNLCKKCVNNCKTCQTTETSCTTCYTDSFYKYFYQQNCLDTCPSDVTVPVDTKCSDCDANCKTCFGTTTNCTSCLSHMRYDSVKGTCTSVCQEGLQIYDSQNALCLYCDKNCATCAGNVSTCTSCRTSQVLTTENICAASCSKINQIPLLGVCKTCELPCAQCSGTTKTCTKCQDNYLLYNKTCVQYCPEKYRADNTTMQCVYEGLICPDGFRVNDAGDGCIPNEFECPEGYMINLQKTACVPAPGSIVPFPFLFLSACLSVLVGGSYIKDKFFTKVKTCLIALLGMQEILIYGLMVCYAGATEKWGPFVLSAIGFAMLITANIIFYMLYRKEIVNDPIFAKWCRLFPKSENYVSLLAVLINFKTIKLFYSGFYGLESCLCQFQDPMKNFFRPLRMITYFSFIFVYIPIIAADVVIFIQVPWGYQLLILAIESFLLSILITVLTILEFRHPERLLMSGDEQYVRIKPKQMGGISNVMGAMVDVDESTLIRSRVIDDDYEIQLRKRALVQILDQVGKNYFDGVDKGIHLGTDLDKCMSKFDEDKLKLRRAFSLEEIKEEGESWVASGDEKITLSDESDQDEFVSEGDEEGKKRRRHSFPLSPRSRKEVPDPNFRAQIIEIQKANLEFMQQDNVFAECRIPDKSKDERKKKTVSRRTQTYLRELLMMDGPDALQDSDMEVVLDDDAEIDKNYTKGLIDGVLDAFSDAESHGTANLKKKSKKKKKKGTKAEVPDFELVDIMGEFEIDDLGNFIILRGEKGELLDKKERRVNRRGYLIDRFGNVINKENQIIFKGIELDSDDEIPAPFGFEKRKKNLLAIGEEEELFKVKETEKQVPDDEDLIDKELKAMRKSGKRKKRQLEDGQIVEEDEGDESSVDSLMAESPAKYAKQSIAGGAAQDGSKLEGGVSGSNKGSAVNIHGSIQKGGASSRRGAKVDEKELIDKLTQAKVPIKKPPQGNAKDGKANLPHVKKALSPRSKGISQKPGTAIAPNASQLGPGELAGSVRPKSVYGAPRRIKRDDTKELFPSLNIESIEQRKLFKIAESIGGMANQIAAENLSKLNLSDASMQNQSRAVIDPDQLEKLKQEHLKDLMTESQMTRHNQYLAAGKTSSVHHFSDQRYAHQQKATQHVLEKVYGNLNDVVAMEEKMIESRMAKHLPARDFSPTDSQATLRKAGRKQDKSEGRRLTGLEAIYLQKFEKKPHQPGIRGKGASSKAKFRTTLQQFVDDPELLIDDGVDHQRQNEMSMMVADKLDRLQRQYVQSNSSNRLSSLPVTSMGFMAVPNIGNMTALSGHAPNIRQTGSMTGLTYDQQQLDPVKMGNWMQRTNQREASLE